MNIEKTITNYFKDQKEIIAVYLFGSYAVNQQRVMSDIDIGLIVENDVVETIKKRQSSYLADLSRILRKDIHLVILNISSEELLAQVFKKGKCLLINKPKELSVYKMRMFSKIADFNHYKRMMQVGFVNKVMEA
jgi:predicted nucleotidyltransferase